MEKRDGQKGNSQETQTGETERVLTLQEAVDAAVVIKDLINLERRNRQDKLTISLVKDALQEALEGKLNKLIVTGLPGSGKSRIINEMIEIARSMGLDFWVVKYDNILQVCFNGGFPPDTDNWSREQWLFLNVVTLVASSNDLYLAYLSDQVAFYAEYNHFLQRLPERKFSKISVEDQFPTLLSLPLNETPSKRLCIIEVPGIKTKSPSAATEADRGVQAIGWLPLWRERNSERYGGNKQFFRVFHVQAEEGVRRQAMMTRSGIVKERISLDNELWLLLLNAGVTAFIGINEETKTLKQKMYLKDCYAMLTVIHERYPLFFYEILRYNDLSKIDFHTKKGWSVVKNWLSRAQYLQVGAQAKQVNDVVGVDPLKPASSLEEIKRSASPDWIEKIWEQFHERVRLETEHIAVTDIAADSFSIPKDITNPLLLAQCVFYLDQVFGRLRIHAGDRYFLLNRYSKKVGEAELEHVRQLWQNT